MSIISREKDLKVLPVLIEQVWNNELVRMCSMVWVNFVIQIAIKQLFFTQNLVWPAENSIET